MGRRRIDAQKKREALARIKAGASSYGEESTRTGLAKSTLHEAMKDIEEGKPSPEPKSPLDAALEAAQVKPADKAPFSPEELAKAGPSALEADQAYCLMTVGSIKFIAASIAGMLTCGLDIFADKRFGTLTDLNPNTQAAVKTATPELAPILRKYLPDGSTLVVLVGAVFLDFGATYMELRRIAQEYQAKREAEEAQKAKVQEQAA